MGRFLPHVQGGDGGGGRSKSKDGTLNLAESLATEDGRSPLRLLSLEEYLPLFFAEICSLMISSSDLGSKNADFSSYLFWFKSSRSSNEEGGVTFTPIKYMFTTLVKT